MDLDAIEKRAGEVLTDPVPYESKTYTLAEDNLELVAEVRRLTEIKDSLIRAHENELDNAQRAERERDEAREKCHHHAAQVGAERLKTQDALDLARRLAEELDRLLPMHAEAAFALVDEHGDPHREAVERISVLLAEAREKGVG